MKNQISKHPHPDTRSAVVTAIVRPKPAQPRLMIIRIERRARHKARGGEVGTGEEGVGVLVEDDTFFPELGDRKCNVGLGVEAGFIAIDGVGPQLLKVLR